MLTRTTRDAKNQVGATVVQELEKSFSNQKVASSIPCRSILEQGTKPLIAPDVQCAISKMCIHCTSHICKSLWIKASAKCATYNVYTFYIYTDGTLHIRSKKCVYI